ncbi:MAG: DMT family transporter [Marinicaulis sp.]|nr:DMT family transporter [Marinicaulis sp.]
MTQSQEISKAQQPGASAADWALLILLVSLGGSAFAMIRVAVETIPPIVVTVGRLWVGALVMIVVMKHAGRRFPDFFVRGKASVTVSQEWRWIIAIAAVAYFAPFFIFPWAQQHIESGLAGVYMAFMPIWTVMLAYFFASESLGVKKIVGFILGLIGVLILMGPEILGDIENSALGAQIAVLIATLCYAGGAVMTRRAPYVRPRAFAAGTLFCAAIMSTPALFFVELDPSTWSLGGLINVVALGLGPTGAAGIIIIIIIQRAGAGFMALANYLVPLWAVAIGAALFNERLETSVFIALPIILLGVAISQRQGRSTATSEAATASTGEMAPVAVDADQ